MQFEPMCGTTIQQSAEEMVALANLHGEAVAAEFNEIPLQANPGADPGEIVARYFAESKRRHEAYVASPEYKMRRRRQRIRDRRERRRREDLLSSAPDEPQWSDTEAWQKAVDVNQDAYGGGVITFARDWARLMEAQIAKGRTVAEVAKGTSSVADRGITGFMYGCAVGILSKAWKHGEDLRRWHNIDHQIGSEGESANASGGVLIW